MARETKKAVPTSKMIAALRWGKEKGKTDLEVFQALYRPKDGKTGFSQFKQRVAKFIEDAMEKGGWTSEDVERITVKQNEATRGRDFDSLRESLADDDFDADAFESELLGDDDKEETAPAKKAG